MNKWGSRQNNIIDDIRSRWMNEGNDWKKDVIIWKEITNERRKEKEKRRKQKIWILGDFQVYLYLRFFCNHKKFATKFVYFFIYCTIISYTTTKNLIHKIKLRRIWKEGFVNLHQSYSNNHKRMLAFPKFRKRPQWELLNFIFLLSMFMLTM